MPISFTCPSCGKTWKAPDHLARLKGKCRECGATYVVPDAGIPVEMRESGTDVAELPFRPDEHCGTLTPGRMSRDDLKKIAAYQTHMLAALIPLVLLQGIIGRVFDYQGRSDVKVILLVLASLALSTVWAALIFRLARKLYGPSWGAIYAIFSFIPCLGLLAVVSVNMEASHVLKKHGIRVGLFGADTSDI
jgi:hypothetical protein